MAVRTDDGHVDARIGWGTGTSWRIDGSFHALEARQEPTTGLTLLVVGSFFFDIHHTTNANFPFTSHPCMLQAAGYVAFPGESRR